MCVRGRLILPAYSDIEGKVGLGQFVRYAKLHEEANVKHVLLESSDWRTRYVMIRATKDIRADDEILLGGRNSRVGDTCR